MRDAGGFESVWRTSDLFQSLRAPDTGGACRSCGHYDSCRGGCMAAKFFTGLPLDGPDPECVQGYGETALASRFWCDPEAFGGSLAPEGAGDDRAAAAEARLRREPARGFRCFLASWPGAEPRPSNGAWPPLGWPSPADELVPVGFRLRADPGTRLVAGGAVLVGGSPVRVLRLTPAGARQVTGWFSGTPVPESAAARRLARRLLDAGIAHPDLGAPASPGPACLAVSRHRPAEVTVVIPVRDRHAELRRCLGGLAGGASRVIVVDDCSADPAAIAAIAAEYGARVVHRPVNGGPGAARNTGLAAAATELVAFLDSDCVPAPGWLDRLLPHFADPAVGAVAPRIVPHEPGTSWLARYEGASSTLDMGARPGIVRPGARVSYVPGAALVVRKAAAGAGFAEGMFVGEDVDFVWRMSAAGLAGPLRAGRGHGSPAPGAAARLVRAPGRLRHIRGGARTAASRRRPALVRLVVDRRRLGRRVLPPPGLRR